MARTSRPRLDIAPGALIFCALGVLILPIRWLTALLAAGMVHELFHIFALRLQKIPLYSVSVTASGAKLSTGPMSARQERIAAAAGPMGSLLLLLLLKAYPELAVCGLCQGLFNLIPVYPFDGGRIVHGTWVPKAVRMVTILVLLSLGIVLSMLLPRWIPVILIGFTMVISRVIRNIPCKAARLAVQ